MERDSQTWRTNLRRPEEGLFTKCGINMDTLLYLTQITNKDLCIAYGTLLNVMWQPGWEEALGENGYMYMYDWAPSLFTWNYHNICLSAITQYKKKVKKNLHSRSPVLTDTSHPPIHTSSCSYRIILPVLLPCHYFLLHYQFCHASEMKLFLANILSIPHRWSFSTNSIYHMVRMEHYLFFKYKCMTLDLKFNKINVISLVLVFFVKWV